MVIQEFYHWDRIGVIRTNRPRVCGTGALECLVGIAARKTILSHEPVMIKDLISIVPQVKKEYKKV